MKLINKLFKLSVLSSFLYFILFILYIIIRKILKMSILPSNKLYTNILGVLLIAVGIMPILLTLIATILRVEINFDGDIDDLEYLKFLGALIFLGIAILYVTNKN